MFLCDLEIFYSTIKFLSALLLKGLSNIHIFKLEGWIFSILTLVIYKIMKLTKKGDEKPNCRWKASCNTYRIFIRN